MGTSFERQRFDRAMRGTPQNRPLPRLRALMCFVACLSTGEADACIRDYREGNEYSSEAVNAFGGSTQVIRRAVSYRQHAIVRDMIRSASRWASLG